MGISISSGSRWLSDLEKEIGCPLYRRNNKAMPLTDAGDYLYRNFCLIGEKVSQLKNELTHFFHPASGNDSYLLYAGLCRTISDAHRR